MPPHRQMNLLLLSSDAKPRLKWTADLHHRFVDAVKQLGGPHKATPKSLMRIMGIQGLTLYHLKSHLQVQFQLQKYRLGRSHHVKQQEKQSSSLNYNAEEDQINDLEMQRKLEEQIEVQRRLQMRIEAQGRYLQSVLKKAQETLSRYSACAIEVEQLASMVDSGCTTSSVTESEGSMVKDTGEKKLLGCSMESSLTFSQKNDDDGKKKIDLNELDSGPTGIDLNLKSNALQLFGSTF